MDRARYGRRIRRPGPLRRGILAVVLGSLLLLAPDRALAHLGLSRAEPGDGDHLASAPRELRLTFTQAVQPAVARLELTGPRGPVELAPLTVHPESAAVLVAAIRGDLVAGSYTVGWQVVGADGHPVRGRYSFVIEPGAQGLAPEPPAPAAPDPSPPEPRSASPIPDESAFDAESPLYVAVRWLTFAGLLGVVGALSFRLVVLPLAVRRKPSLGPSLLHGAGERAAGWGVALSVLLAVSALLRLYAQSLAVHGSADALDPSLVGTLLSSTQWGQGWMLQAAATLVALGGFALARNRPAAGWPIAALGGIAVAFTPGLSGHAAATSDLTTLAVLADGLHVLGAGAWLGGLLLVVMVGVPAALQQKSGERGSAVAALVNAFSPAALTFAAVVVVTGVFAAWLHLGSVAGLWESAYGRTLLLKLAVLCVVFGTGAYNWRRVRPALDAETGVTRLRRSASVELATALVVLGVTAVLVATAPPRETGDLADAGSPAAAGARDQNR